MGDANGTQHYLDPVAAYCKENRLPPLTALVTYKDRNKAGIGLNRWLRGQSIDEAQKLVRSYGRWSEHIPAPENFETAAEWAMNNWWEDAMGGKR